MYTLNQQSLFIPCGSRILLLAAAISLSFACEFSDTDTDTHSDVPTEDTSDPTPPPPPQPDGCVETIPLGEAGAHKVEGYEFTFQSDTSGYAVSPPLILDTPDDLISLALTVTGSGPFGFSVQDSTGADWSNDVQNASTDTSRNQMALPTNFPTDPTSECLTIRVVADGAAVGQTANLSIVSRRGGTAKTIDLNFVFFDGLDQEITQAEYQAMIDQINRTWSTDGGPTVGDSAVYTAEGNGLVTYTQASSLTGYQVEPDVVDGVDIFIVRDITDGPEGLLGFAGGIPGVLGIDGLSGSGVIIALDAHRYASGELATTILGATIAHETGHQVGLNHTVEQSGESLASYTDVPVCGPENDTNGDQIVDAQECVGLGAENFMFWQASGLHSPRVSPEQAFVMNQSAAGR